MSSSGLVDSWAAVAEELRLWFGGCWSSAVITQHDGHQSSRVLTQHASGKWGNCLFTFRERLSAQFACCRQKRLSDLPAELVDGVLPVLQLQPL